MSWKREVEGIEKRRELATQHGGREAVELHHRKGRLTIRERIDVLVDPGSFREQGPIAGHSEVDENGELREFTPANYVLGIGDVDGRPCVVGGEDFTQRGGSPTPAGLRKSVYAEELACQYRLPLVRLLEGGGGSVRGPSKQGRAPAGDPVFSTPRFASVARALTIAPVASAAMGPVAGLPAARLVASHYAVMSRATAQVMVAGPAVVERALGEQRSKQDLGGADVHAGSGVVDGVADDERGAIEAIRRFLSYLPSNIDGLAPIWRSDDAVERCDEELLSLVPRNRRHTYDMRQLIRHVVDRDSFFELTPAYGPSQITALARLNGQPVGVLGNDPHYNAGAMDAAGAQKFRRFVELCDTFHLPVVSFVDEPGFMIGSEAERAGTIRYGTSAICAVMQAQIPWASVLVRRAFGVAAAAHFAAGSYVLSWPSAQTGALPVEGGVAVAFKREIEAAEDPEAMRRDIETRLAAASSPFPRAEGFSVHDLIDPRTTRPALIRWIDLVQPLLQRQLGPRAYGYRP
jgi:acetyl-CoA carboxylase carboxyltransferase component